MLYYPKRDFCEGGNMSAIWGVLGQGDKAEYRETFLEVYKNKTKIEKYDAYESGNIFMGCGMQYFTEPSHREILPLAIDNRIVVTADAILDNRKEIAEFLGTGSFCPDGELIARAYLKEGIQSVKRFRGIFSFAIYDLELNKLYLATDQTSARCLYYYVDGEKIFFSTLIEPILKSCPEIDINEIGIKDFLFAPGLLPCLVAGTTPYQGVEQVKPGTYIEWCDGKITETIYYDIHNTVNKHTSKTAKEYGENFVKLYKECVADAIRVEGGVGIAMSSGFDSASVGALAAAQLKQEKKKMHSYTYVPYMEVPGVKRRDAIFDEREGVLEIAKMYDNIIPQFINNEGKNCIESVADEIDILEIPFKAYVNMPNLCEIYRRAYDDECKVVLNGQFGNMSVSYGFIDHILFDIYEKKHYVKFLLWLNNYCKLSGEGRKIALRQCIGYYRETEKEYKKGIKYDNDNPFVSDSLFEGYPYNDRISKGRLDRLVNGPYTSAKYRENAVKTSILAYIGCLETKMSLCYGVVVRDPTKDIRIMEFCYHLPYELFAYKGKTRWLIRENMKDYLPGMIINNQNKRGVQNYDYLARIVRDWDEIKTMLEDAVQYVDLPYINCKKIKEYIDTVGNKIENHDEIKEDYLFFVYVLAQLFRWYKK